MTAAELIAELSNHPADMPVMFTAEAGQVVLPVEEVEAIPNLHWCDDAENVVMLWARGC